MLNRQSEEKKQQLIIEIQEFYEKLENKNLKIITQKYEISLATAKKYINMSKDEIKSMDSPKNYKKCDSAMNIWLNIIYKMMLDGHNNETIYFYIVKLKNFNQSKPTLCSYIYLIGKNNFPNRAPFYPKNILEQVLPNNIICIKRNELFKYLLTCNPKTAKDKTIDRFINLIKKNILLLTEYKQFFVNFTN